MENVAFIVFVALSHTEIIATLFTPAISAPVIETFAWPRAPISYASRAPYVVLELLKLVHLLEDFQLSIPASYRADIECAPQE